MPLNAEHALHTLKRYGVTGEDIHKWMDEPSRVIGNHRKFRHDPEQQIPKIFLKKYGDELARNIILDHIFLDMQYKQHEPIIEPNLEIQKTKIEHEFNNHIISTIEELYLDIQERLYGNRQYDEFNKTITYNDIDIPIHKLSNHGIPHAHRELIIKLVIEKTKKWIRKNGLTYRNFPRERANIEDDLRIKSRKEKGSLYLVSPYHPRKTKITA